MLGRPQSEEELQKREAIGVIRASRFVRLFSRSHKPITMATICEIHKHIFQEAWLDIAGVYRDEELKITDSQHLPPHHTAVRTLMEQADKELEQRTGQLMQAEGIILNIGNATEEELTTIGKVITTAAWLHHAITYIHPFREGNGRTARLAANLILERYGLIGISIKVEKETQLLPPRRR